MIGMVDAQFKNRYDIDITFSEYRDIDTDIQSGPEKNCTKINALSFYNSLQ